MNSPNNQDTNSKQGFGEDLEKHSAMEKKNKWSYHLKRIKPDN